MKCSELLDSSNRANENLRFFYSLIHWIILIKHKIMESLDFFCKDSFEDPSWGSLYTSVVPSITSWSVPYCYVFIEIKVSTQNCFWIRLLRLLQVTLHNVEWSKLKLSYLITLCEYRLGSYLRLRCRVKDEDVSKLISKQKKRESPFAVSEKPRLDKYFFFRKNILICRPELWNFSTNESATPLLLTRATVVWMADLRRDQLSNKTDRLKSINWFPFLNDWAGTSFASRLIVILIQITN